MYKESCVILVAIDAVIIYSATNSYELLLQYSLLLMVL